MRFITTSRNLLSILFLLSIELSFAQKNPAELFDDACSDCHSIGEGDLKGPDLMGMEQRYSEEWLIQFIQSSKTMIEAGDPQAVKIWEKFKKGKMPKTDLPVEEIKSIISYVKSLNKNAVETGLKPVSTAKKQGDLPSNVSPSTAKTTSEENAVSEIPSGSNATTSSDNTARIDELEKKIDQLLHFQRRSASIEITEEDIKKGKDLFCGVIPFENGAPNCVSCHNIAVIDTLNWNPSALDIANRYMDDKNIDFENLLLHPKTDRLKKLLEGHPLTEREAFTLKAYLQTIKKNGLFDPKTNSPVSMTFVGVIIIMLLAIIDLLFTKWIKFRIIPILIFIGSIGYIFLVSFTEVKSVGMSLNYEPDQPIKFSHKIHAGENGINCLYCHSTPEYSKISGIPPTEVCINCHYKIKSGTKSWKFEIDKIFSALETKQPINWIKIHNLPDHVFFSHAQHVGVGKIECRQCHGKVEEMDRVKQVSPLTMEWCLDCHRTKKINVMDNKFYDSYTGLHEDIKSGKVNPDSITVDYLNKSDCYTCHY